MKMLLSLLTAAGLCVTLPNLSIAEPPAPVWKTKPAKAETTPDATSSADPATAEPTPAPAPPPAPDPSQDLGGFVDSAKDAFKVSPFAGLVVLLWGVGRILYSQREKFGLFATTRARILLTGVIGVLAAASVSLAAGHWDWNSIIGVILGTALAYLNPEKPAKPKPA